MKVEIFCLCDFAQASDHGKLSLIGIFDSLEAISLPAIHGLLAIAIKLRSDANEIGQKRFKISFLAPDKSPIAPDIESSISIPLPPNLRQTNIQIVTLIPQLRLPQFGEYSIALDIDGQEVASTALYLRQTTEQPPHSQMPPLAA
jgi:hypothetical protein